MTQAYAKAARVGGAEIYRHTRVTALARRADGWQVDTEKGGLLAEHVVNAGGLWAREVGRMVGIELPLLAMAHQYLVTDDVPEVAAREREIAHAIDFAGEIYMRQEGKGVVLGTYECDDVPWSERETPWDFGHELLPPDLDRIAGSLEEVSGPGAERWLERLLANRLPAAGRIALAPMLNARGRIIGDFTVARMAGERFLLFGSGIAESYHMRWFAAQLPARGVVLCSRRRDMVGLSIAGPRAHALLERVAAADVSAQAFRFLDIRAMSLGPVPALVGRISFTGDLGYEIWVSPDYQLALFELLRREGEDLGLRLFGARALNSLRLEKCFGTFTREYTPDFSPLEAGLERFVKLDKGEFTGRDALLRDRDEGPTRRLVGLVVDDAGVDVFADEPVLDGEGVCGSVTSGGYAHWSGCSMALGYVPLALAQDGAQLVIEILGERRPATVRCRPVFDPEGAWMRG